MNIKSFGDMGANHSHATLLTYAEVQGQRIVRRFYLDLMAGWPPKVLASTINPSNRLIPQGQKILNNSTFHFFACKGAMQDTYEEVSHKSHGITAFTSNRVRNPASSLHKSEPKTLLEAIDVERMYQVFGPRLLFP